MSPVLGTLLKYVGCLLLAVLVLGAYAFVLALVRESRANRDPILRRRTEITARTKGDARKFWRRPHVERGIVAAVDDPTDEPGGES